MTNTFKPHSTSPKHFVIVNPSQDLVNYAKTLTAGGWAKVQPNGAIVVHNNYRQHVENKATKEARLATVAPRFSDFDEFDRWVWDNINSGKLAQYLSDLTVGQWNDHYAGKTVKEIEEEK